MRYTLDLLLIPLFFLGLCLPLAENMLGGDPAPPPHENRVLAAAPTFGMNLQAITSFPHDFESYYNDHFGWRNSLIHAQNYLTIALLGVSSTPKVIIGSNGWLYYGLPQCRESYRSAHLFTDEQLLGLQQGLVKTRDWLSQKNISYLNIWAPNKDTVYPEYLPSWMVKVNSTSRLDQWFEQMTANTDVPVLDLRPALFNAKEEGLIYHKTDSHWNYAGAYVAYREIMKSLKSFSDTLEEIDPNRVKIVVTKWPGGDLSGMLDMSDYYFGEVRTATIDKPKSQKAAFDETGLNLPKEVQVTATELPGSNAPRLVMFHDSFGAALKPYLSETFSRAVFLSLGAFNTVVVEREKPDLVLEVHVERQLTPSNIGS